MVSFVELFQTGCPGRDKFLSRFFGLFNEEVVRYWCKYPQAPYEDLGRPTLYEPGEKRGHTLDFTLRHKETRRIFIAEMKCELEFENYRYLALREPWQLEHHRSQKAFCKFLELAKNPEAYEVRVGGSQIRVDGAVLIWGVVLPEGRRTVIEKYGFAEVLAVEDMIKDLRQWKPGEWIQRIEQIQGWVNQLLEALK
ncbi:hypothetical protein [Thermoanaerobacter wiegelii]|uniref:Uncharacterized protein n=1 Tax=Thermoanaerobacter wiegelii Rt8.B1 TaxID=697303 RepID=G2MRH9_9THEO|nr:hypothetical protein [Thermoanaerobacter wiegelii]AEM79341.1 hypothetical protein Thewi_1962 [Thermoanaerobacter wiegelii Rt8.B1]